MRSAVFVPFLLLAASPATADLDLVIAPGTAETGVPVELQVTGGLADSCWEYVGWSVAYEGVTATVSIVTRYDNPEAAGCLPMVIPYECFPEVVFAAPGTWTLRVVEVRSRPGGDLPPDVREATVDVSGEVPDAPDGWGTAKARYR